MNKPDTNQSHSECARYAEGESGTMMGDNWPGVQLLLVRLGTKASLKRGRLRGGLKGEGLPQ